MENVLMYQLGASWERGPAGFSPPDGGSLNMKPWTSIREGVVAGMPTYGSAQLLSKGWHADGALGTTTHYTINLSLNSSIFFEDCILSTASRA